MAKCVELKEICFKTANFSRQHMATCIELQKMSLKKLYCASRVAQRSKAMHHSVAVSLQPGVQSQAVSLPAVTGSPIGRREIGSDSSGIGEGLAGGALLGSSRSSDVLWLTFCRLTPVIS
jgi:hypothetical protein